MSVNTRISKSEKETKDLAGALLKRHWDILRRRALLFALSGELGTGKTIFAKGIGEYLRVTRPIRSPGFVLVAEYLYSGGKPRKVRFRSPRGKLFHVDLWRIDDESEARALGIEEMIHPGNIILIEWAQKMSSFLKELCRRHDLKVILIAFEHRGGNERRIKVTNSDCGRRSKM